MRANAEKELYGSIPKKCSAESFKISVQAEFMAKTLNEAKFAEAFGKCCNLKESP